MIKNNFEIQLNCLLIEKIVRDLVLQGTSNDKELVEAIDQQFHPQNEWEMEMYSEAILYAKLGVLN